MALLRLCFFHSNEFWENIAEEHSIDRQGHCSDSNDQTGVYFHGQSSEKQTSVPMKKDRSIDLDGQFSPRSLLVDLDPSTTISNRRSRNENILLGQWSAAFNGGKGYYSEGPSLIDPLFNVLRREMESCDCFQSIQLCHAISGGTGGGLGALIISKIQEEFPDRWFPLENCLH